jgi:hypothetical protein
VPRVIGFASGYLPGVVSLARAGARTREIDVLDIRAVEWFDGRAPPARPPPAPAPGFELAGSIVRSNFRLYRFVSARTRLVTPRELRAKRLLPRDSMVALAR